MPSEQTGWGGRPGFAPRFLPFCAEETVKLGPGGLCLGPSQLPTLMSPSCSLTARTGQPPHHLLSWLPGRTPVPCILHPQCQLHKWRQMTQAMPHQGARRDLGTHPSTCASLPLPRAPAPLGEHRSRRQRASLGQLPEPWPDFQPFSVM